MTPIQTKVLIIDDDPGVLFLHEIIVKESKLSLTPECYNDAQKALKYIKSIDESGSKLLIFLDINMPKMSGWSFLDALVNTIEFMDIKVVMVTSSLSKIDREKTSDYPFVIDFWEKPMDETQTQLLHERLSDWIVA